MPSNYKKLGSYIQVVNIRNTDDRKDNLLGLSVRKVFIKTIANTIGTDFKTYKVVTDGSCKDKARFRFVSYDPDIYVNEKANKFIAKNIKKQKPPTKVDDYIFIQDDFDYVVQQITDRRIDICQDDYFRFMHVGLALASEFGPSGENAFHTICSIGSKYDSKNAPKQYKQFCQNKDGRVGIGTFYHYCKEAGIQIYSEKTKAIINKVKVAKAQGNPTINTIASNLKVTHDIEITDNDAVLIQNLIDSKKDYSKLFNIETTKIGMNVESNNIDDFDFSKILKAYSEGVIGISAEYKPARPHDQGPKQFLENPVFTKIMFEEFMNKPFLNPREKAKLEKFVQIKNFTHDIDINKENCLLQFTYDVDLHLPQTLSKINRPGYDIFQETDLTDLYIHGQKKVYFDADNRINLLCYFTQDNTMKSNLIQKEYDSYNLFKSSLLKEKY